MPDPRVWIAQCLCGPNRHAIAALAGEADSATEALDLLTRLRAGIADLRQADLNPWCAICGSPEAAWLYQIDRTRFRTMKEAGPELARTAAGNAVANALFGTHGPTRPGRG